MQRAQAALLLLLLPLYVAPILPCYAKLRTLVLFCLLVAILGRQRFI